MRLLVLTQSFAPVFEGGTERVARAQARALAAAGHAVRVVGAVAPEGAGTFEVDGLPVHLIAEEPPAGALDALVAQRLWLERPARRDAVLALAAEHGPFDAVHVQHFASLSLGLVPHFAGVGARVVVSLHDLFATCARFFRDPPDPAVTCPVPGAELRVSVEEPGDGCALGYVNARLELLVHEARIAGVGVGAAPVDVFSRLA